MSRRRVVVTGVGMLTPIGNTTSEAWANALAGMSGAAPIESFDTTDYAVKFSSSVKGFDPTHWMEKKEARRVDPFIQFGMAAAVQAIADAGIPSHPPDGDRYGVAIGSGIGGLPTIEDTHIPLARSGPRRVSPFFVPASDDQHDFGQRVDPFTDSADPTSRSSPHARPAPTTSAFEHAHDSIRRSRRDDRRAARKMATSPA